MLVETDPATGATYLVLREGPVARTEWVGELVSIDLDEDGSPVGLEVATHLRLVPEGAWHAVINLHPELKPVIAPFLH